jgi:hypothetical protein
VEVHRDSRGADEPEQGVRAEASALVAACEAVWHAVQRHHPDVPDVVIVLGTGVERGRLVKLGHWCGARWIADGKVRGEVLLAGEALHLPPESVLEVLLHEAAHGVNASRGIQDASRGGRYHNRRFKETAEELGLAVEAMPPYGWARTSIDGQARDRYQNEIAQLGSAMRIARRVAADVRVGPDGEVGNGGRARDVDEARGRDRQRPATCGCGRRLRMAPSVLAQGPVLCGVCDEPFAIGRTVRASVSPSGSLRGAAEDRDAGTARTGVAASITDHRRLSPVQREGLATLVDIGASPDGALLLAETGAWYAARKEGRERPLALTANADSDSANRAARAMLKLDGTLCEHAAMVSGRELMIGDLVTVTPTVSRVVDVDGVDLAPSGVFGTVERANHSHSEITIDFATIGRQTISIDSPAAAALVYGYAERDAAEESLLPDVLTRSPRAELPPLSLGNELLP